MGRIIKGKKLPRQDIDDVFNAFYRLEAAISDGQNEYKTDHVMTKLVTVIEQFFRCIVQFQLEDNPDRNPKEITLNPLMIEDIIEAVSKKTRNVTVGLIVSFSHSFQSTDAIKDSMKGYGITNIFSGKNGLDIKKYEELFRLRHELVHTINPPSKPDLELTDYHKMVEDLMRHVLGRYEAVDRSFGVLKGMALYEMNSDDRAKECLETALKSYGLTARLKPGNADAHFNKGSVLLDLERYGEALKCFEKVIKKKPSDVDALHGKWVALSNLKRYGEALELTDRMIEIYPNDPDMYSFKGLTLIDLEKSDEALEQIDKAIMMNPYDTSMHISKAEVLSGRELYDEALKCADKAIELESDEAYFYYMKGNVLLDLERYKEALECFDKMIQLDPDDHAAYDSKSSTLEKLGRHDEARKHADKAEKLRKEQDDQED